MANYININKTARIEAQGTHTNGNTKGVVCITNPAFFTSITDAAETAEVHISVMSNHVREVSKTCKGNVYMKINDPRVVPALAETAAKANARADKAEAEKRAMEAEMAEFRKWKAEQEAARKAEEERQKQEAKLNDKLAKLEAERERRLARLERCDNEIARVKMELELLNGNGKEVV